MLDLQGRVLRRVEQSAIQPLRLACSRSGLVAFVGETATQPSELWLIDENGERAACVTNLHREYPKAALQSPRLRKFTSFDGRQIEAAFYSPAGLPAGFKPPLVVYVHGGPTGRWADWFYYRVHCLVARGFAVLLPNIRGSTGYGWEFLTANRGDWGGGDYRDVMAGVDDLVRAGLVDGDRVGICGWSYGGYMAAWATTQTNRFRAAVVGAGMSNLQSLFGNELIATSHYDRWFLGLPYEVPRLYRERSPITHISKATTPTLILQGETDPITPAAQSRELYRGLRHYGIESQLVVYPREGHGLREEAHLIDQIDRIARWFENHMEPKR
ncbi:MAG: S9 family peptidase [Isosphaeraceae bacterium]|nr:S9 family peptidase [Isosphaeraceae bacterium]